MLTQPSEFTIDGGYTRGAVTVKIRRNSIQATDCVTAKKYSGIRSSSFSPSFSIWTENFSEQSPDSTTSDPGSIVILGKIDAGF